MHWHLQPTRLTLRFYENENGYENRKPFIGTAQIDLKSNGEAYVHAMKNDRPVSRATLRQIANELVTKYNVTKIKWEHSEKDQEFDTRPADL